MTAQYAADNGDGKRRSLGSNATGARVSLPAASLGAMAGETLKYTAAGLPPGLSVTAAGTITGAVATAAAPAKAATYRVTFSAANAAGETATVSFSWQVSPACARSPSPASSALTCPDGS